MPEDSAVDIVLGVPGHWVNRSEIVTSIAGRSQGYIFAGGLLMDTNSNQHFLLEIEEHNTGLRNAFKLAGRGLFAETLLDDIDRHTFTLYVSGPGGSSTAARPMMDVAVGLIKAGGLAVKVESSGKAFSSEQWLKCVEYKDTDKAALYDAFVTLISNGRELYTCGMHNLGYPDAVIDAKGAPEETAKLLEIFQLYILRENPVLADGHTFSISADSPYYRMHLESYTFYPPGDLFHNPFGMWRLKPI